MNNRINYIARELGCKNPEIIGKDHEKNTQKKKPTVFPEIFIER
jgi:hypothetical protein